ncbi:DUF1016 N-terminal domain-containing protein [Amedibacillus sp. YH-ame10]
MLKLYWYFEKDIVERKTELIYVSGFYSTLSQSLKNEFPDMKGFSVTNLKYINAFICFMNPVPRILNSLLMFRNSIFSTNGHHVLIIRKSKDISICHTYYKYNVKLTIFDIIKAVV